MAAEEEKTEEASEEEPSPKKGKGKLIIIIIAVVLLLGGGAAAYFFLFRKPPAEVTEEGGEEVVEEGGETTTEEGGETTTEEGGETTTPQLKEGIIFPLDHFIVNVSDLAGETRYLKIEIKLELGNDTMQAEIENRVPKIRDGIVTVLTNKSVSDINDSKGKMKLKEEIRARINSFITSGKVEEVYFTDFIIQ